MRAAGTPGRARATLSDIQRMWGRTEVEGDRAIRTGMYGLKEVWRLVSGKGLSAVYERVTEGG